MKKPSVATEKLLYNTHVKGSTSEFDSNWKGRLEAQYNHWCDGAPNNQVQLAFLSHWQVFNELYPEHFSSPGTVLEVGCGRGSLSSFFADHGWHCCLLDYSHSVLQTAKNIFSRNGHHAEYLNGDAMQLPIQDNAYDVVASIGLLEHFEDIETILKEQYRLLKPGGLFLGYVVPEKPENIQKYFYWLNFLLKLLFKCVSRGANRSVAKEAIYRSDLGSERYLEVLDQLDVEQINVVGMYPLPMISHSPEFPFSLMHPVMEKILVKLYGVILFLRKKIFKRHGWMCKEKTGQAFLLAFVKAR